MHNSNESEPETGQLWRKRPTLPREIHIGGSFFEWIEQTDDPKFDEIRKRIELLWLRVPEASRPEFTSRLRAKAKQHEGASLPIVLCVAWNYFEHEPDFEDVVKTTARRAESLARRGVHAVFWSREVYPWNPAPVLPRLLHWGSSLIVPLLHTWTGDATDVRSYIAT